MMVIEPDVARYTRCVGIAGLELVTARYHAHTFAPHLHDFYAVSLNDRGRGVFECRRAMRDAVPGTCNLIAPGEVHTGRATSDAGWHYRNLYIEPSLMSSLLAGLEVEIRTEIRFATPSVDDPVLARRLGRALTSLAAPRSRLDRESQLLGVIARLVAHHVACPRALSAAGLEPAGVGRVRDWLEVHADEDVSVSELATVAVLSPYHLVRAFHRHVGVPPHRYQMIVRVLRARRLLRDGEPVAEVAQRTGFCDQSHLTRWFKQMLGTTPGRYASA